MKIVLTCEHAGNNIPEKYQHLFSKAKKVLNSHRGFDIGAYKIFNDLTKFSDHHIYTNISRLLIDTNRSIGSKYLFSDYTRVPDKKIREDICNSYYLPYRDNVNGFINTNIKRENIFHISVHSFTPILNNKKRNADIGILYNPKSKNEKILADKIKRMIKSFSPDLKIRYNYPYLGISDGFTTYLREIFSYNKYSGIELEVNQKLFKNKEVINKIILSVQEFMIQIKK